MQEIRIPVGQVGAGSQPAEEDGANLDILQLPEEIVLRFDVRRTGGRFVNTRTPSLSK